MDCRGWEHGLAHVHLRWTNWTKHTIFGIFFWNRHVWRGTVRCTQYLDIHCIRYRNRNRKFASFEMVEWTCRARKPTEFFRLILLRYVCRRICRLCGVVRSIMAGFHSVDPGSNPGTSTLLDAYWSKNCSNHPPYPAGGSKTIEPIKDMNKISKITTTIIVITIAPIPKPATVV